MLSVVTKSLIAPARRYSRGASARRVAVRATIWTMLCLGALLMILPFLWLLSSSLKTQSQLWVFPPEWIPNPVMWSNYSISLTYMPFNLYILNTLKIAVPVVIGTVLSASLCGYGFARLEFPGRDLIFGCFLSTMMLPAIVTMIPTFILFTRLGWVDTLRPLIIPPILGGGAFNIFLFRQFFRTIPNDLSDAARIDGCSELSIYWRIILPLSKPVLATVAIFTFLFQWNDFIGPLLYLHSDTNWTIALGLAAFQGQYSTHWHLLMAASTAMTLPTVAVFFLAQRYFVEGIVLTGIKGA